MKHPLMAIVIVVALAFAVDVYMNRYEISVTSSAIVQMNRITGVTCLVGTAKCAEFGGKFFDTGAPDNQ